MTTQDARSLADFLNRSSTRFQSSVLELTTRSCILIVDRQGSGTKGGPVTLEPILNLEEYIGLVENRYPSELVSLLKSWHFASSVASEPASTSEDG